MIASTENVAGNSDPVFARLAEGSPELFITPAPDAPPLSRTFEMVCLVDRAQAFLLTEPMDPAEVRQLFSLGGRHWRNHILLAKRWGLWGVLAEPGWAEAHMQRDRPSGTKMTFA